METKTNERGTVVVEVELPGPGLRDPSWVVTVLPEWADRVAALADVLKYGPSYSRATRESLIDIDRLVRMGVCMVAADLLVAAESHAARARMVWPELRP